VSANPVRHDEEERMIGLVVASGQHADLAVEAQQVDRIGDDADWFFATASLHESVGWTPVSATPLRVLWLRTPLGLVGIRVAGKLVMRSVAAKAVLPLPVSIARRGATQAVVLDGERPILVLAPSRIVRPLSSD
jgi:hypothetical protein